MTTADLGPERRERLLEAVRQRGTVRVSDLAQELDVSLMTIRRDVAALAEEGRLERIHGGARRTGGPVAQEPAPSAKRLLNPEAKRRIAELAAARIRPGEVVGLGSGTTVLALAERLVEVPELTIATNSVPVAEVFWARSSARVILSGGERTPSQALVGPLAMQTLGGLHLDTVVLGTHGLDIEAGCTTPNLLEAQVNRVLMAQSRRALLLADSDKWGVVGLTTFATLQELDVLVSDAALPSSAVAALRAEGVEVLVPRG